MSDRRIYQHWPANWAAIVRRRGVAPRVLYALSIAAFTAAAYIAEGGGLASALGVLAAGLALAAFVEMLGMA